MCASSPYDIHEACGGSFPASLREYIHCVCVCVDDDQLMWEAGNPSMFVGGGWEVMFIALLPPVD